MQENYWLIIKIKGANNAPLPPCYATLHYGGKYAFPRFQYQHNFAKYKVCVCT